MNLNLWLRVVTLILAIQRAVGGEITAKQSKANGLMRANESVFLTQVAIVGAETVKSGAQC